VHAQTTREQLWKEVFNTVVAIKIF
jgi:hypothetical protein